MLIHNMPPPFEERKLRSLKINRSVAFRRKIQIFILLSNILLSLIGIEMVCKILENAKIRIGDIYKMNS